MKDNEFGSYLKSLREAEGMSQFQLGKLVKVTDKSVSKWENGHTKPRLEVAMKLSEIFSVSIDEFLKRMCS